MAEGLDEIDPEVAERLYNPDMLDPMQPIGPSAWRDFVAKNPPPWKIGYASSYAGNTWRAAVMDELAEHRSFRNGRNLACCPKWSSPSPT